MSDYQDFQQLEQLKILVVGESCQDIYHYGTVDRVSPEAPVPILNCDPTGRNREVLGGMSINVATNIEKFGPYVDLLTHDLKLIRKHRFSDVRSRHQLMRMDEEFDIPQATEEWDFDYYDAIVVSDYNKGFLTDSYLSEQTAASSNHTIPIFVDTKRPDLSCFHNAVIKLNEKEFENIVEPPPASSTIVTTLGSGGARWGGLSYTALEVDAHDTTGAGDVFIASLSVLSFLFDNLGEAIEKAVDLATLSVMHTGVYTLSYDDIKGVLQ